MGTWAEFVLRPSQTASCAVSCVGRTDPAGTIAS